MMIEAEATSTLETFLTDIRSRVERTLDDLLPPESAMPERLYQAMRYSVMGGGKRLRAAFVYATGQMLNIPQQELDLPAAAVECLHAYSLIHDDLPCMDDDDLRRGKPSCHRAFDETTAVLAGDALQCFAFELLALTRHPLGLKMVQTLAQASGPSGMVAGQFIDVLSTGKTLDLETLQLMHRLKTGALISASVVLGGLVANIEDPAKLRQLRLFGASIGLAFQVQDDILDATSSTELLGKAAGADDAHNKATFVRLLGLEKASEMANAYVAAAKDALAPFGSAASQLEALSTYVTKRLY